MGPCSDHGSLYQPDSILVKRSLILFHKCGLDGLRSITFSYKKFSNFVFISLKNGCEVVAAQSSSILFIASFQFLMLITFIAELHFLVILLSLRSWFQFL